MLITKEMIDPIIKQRYELKAELNKIEDVLTSMRSICDHNYVMEGYGSHKDYYKCSICGMTYSE